MCFLVSSAFFWFSFIFSYSLGKYYRHLYSIPNNWYLHFHGLNENGIVLNRQNITTTFFDRKKTSFSHIRIKTTVLVTANSHWTYLLLANGDQRSAHTQTHIKTDGNTLHTQAHHYECGGRGLPLHDMKNLPCL